MKTVDTLKSYVYKGGSLTATGHGKPQHELAAKAYTKIRILREATETTVTEWEYGKGNRDKIKPRNKARKPERWAETDG